MPDPRKPSLLSSPLARYLEEDHARLDALLRASVADEQQLDIDAFEQFRAGLLRHIGIEEKLLLPLLRRQAELRSVVATLRVEHAALASLMVPTPDRSLAREIAGLLAEHNTREEGPSGIYEQCAALAGLEAEALLERAQATPPPPLAKHFDGSGAHRTAAEALRAAERATARRERE
jgi:hypothetical protein